MKKILIGMLCLISIIGQTQNIDSVDIQKNAISWISSAQMGIIFDGNEGQGASGKLITSFSSGVSYGKFEAMIGLGLNDYYNYVVVPIVLELRYDILKSSNTPFFYVFAGKGMAVTKNDLQQFNSRTDGKLNAGVGVGFKWGNGPIDFFVKGGYCVQIIKSLNSNSYYYSIQDALSSYYNPNQGQASELIRQMNRVSFSLGLNF